MAKMRKVLTMAGSQTKKTLAQLKRAQKMRFQKCWSRKFTQTDTLHKTNKSPLKMDGWKISFLLGWPIFRCDLVSFRFSGSVPDHCEKRMNVWLTCNYRAQLCSRPRKSESCAQCFFVNEFFYPKTHPISLEVKD